MSSRLRSLLWLCATLALSGCAAYQWETPPTSIPQDIHLAPVVNRSTAPQIRALLTDELRETFLRMGGWSLRSEKDASAVIEVTVLDYTRRRAATSSADTERGLSFDTKLTAEVRVRDAATDKDLLPPFTVEVTGVALEAPNLPENERSALGPLCGRLASQIQDRLRDGW